MTIRPATSEVWLVTGAQHLYGPGPLEQVAAHSRTVAKALSAAPAVPYPVAFHSVLTTPEAIREVCLAANHAPHCAGLVLWMHTFSPAKMWIGGLSALRKPFAHLHTQFNRDLPWGEIDMDFMNLNQSAHGDREAGFLHARMRLPRKIVVGHWEDPEVQERLGAWMRVARAWQDLQGAKFARFGDNMRQVAVTEGDKVAAESRFGFSVAAHGVGDLVAEVQAAPEARVTRLCSEYAESYDLAKELRKGGARHDSLREAARIEAGLRSFLEKGGYKGFTTNFEDLHGLRQLPGLAVQRLMHDGYGFGAEGDWKPAALLRTMKVMGDGLTGGTSFMEDYTYHLDPKGSLVLGAHMLEVCESIASAKPALEIHPLGIGGREDPPRLVFTAPGGPGGQRLRHRPGQPVPARRERGRRRQAAQAPAAAAGGAGGLAMPARFQDGVRGVDPGRWSSPHRLQLRGDGGAPRGLRGDRGRRDGADRRGDPPGPV